MITPWLMRWKPEDQYIACRVDRGAFIFHTDSQWKEFTTPELLNPQVRLEERRTYLILPGTMGAIIL